MSSRHVIPSTYSSALTFLLGGRDKTRRTVANNTVVHRLHGDRIALRLHYTDVVTWFADGSVTLRTGGWNTPTTLDRIRAALPRRYSIESHRGHWTLTDNETGRVAWFLGEAFIQADGTITSPAGEPRAVVCTSTKRAGLYETVGDPVSLAEARALADEAAKTFLRVKVLLPATGSEVWSHSVARCDKHTERFGDRYGRCPYCAAGLYVREAATA